MQWVCLGAICRLWQVGGGDWMEVAEEIRSEVLNGLIADPWRDRFVLSLDFGIVAKVNVYVQWWR